MGRLLAGARKENMKTTNRFIPIKATLCAVLLFAAGCSGSDDSTSALGVGVESDDAATEASEAAAAGDNAAATSDGTPTSESTPPAAGSGNGPSNEELEQCMVGGWQASNDELNRLIQAQLSALPGANVTIDSGSMIGSFRADGTADMTTAITGGGFVDGLGPVELKIDAFQDVTWSVAESVLTMNIVSWDFDASLNGQPIGDVPGPVPGEATTAVVACIDDKLVVAPNSPGATQLQIMPSNWDRVS